MRIKLFIFIFCLSALNSSMLVQSNARATQVQPRHIHTSSALIIEVRHPAGHALSIQRYGGFSPRYKIGPYIRPAYLQERLRVNKQRYSGFKRIYKERCKHCQRYSGFTQNYLRSRYRYLGRYPSGAYATIFRTY